MAAQVEMEEITSKLEEEAMVAEAVVADAEVIFHKLK